MRLLAISPISHFGGAEILLLDLLRELGARGHEVMLVSCGDVGDLPSLTESCGIRAVTAPVFRLRNPKAVLRTACVVRSVMSTFHPDRVHCNHPAGALIGALASRGAVPLSVQLLDPPKRLEPGALLMASVRADYISISDETSAAYRYRLPLRRSLTTIRPGRDVEALRADAMRGSAGRVLRAAGLDERARPLVVMVGRLQEFKGIFRFLEVASELAEVTFLHVGPDAPTEPGTRARVLQRIYDAGLEGRAGLAGAVATQDLAAVVQRADLLVHLAPQETFGLVLIEAMAVGTPPVALPGPGPRVILAGGGGVLLEADGDMARVAGTLRALLSNPTAMTALGRRARERSEEFGVDRIVSRYERVLTADD